MLASPTVLWANPGYDPWSPCTDVKYTLPTTCRDVKYNLPTTCTDVKYNLPTNCRDVKCNLPTNGSGTGRELQSNFNASKWNPYLHLLGHIFSFLYMNKPIWVITRGILFSLILIFKCSITARLWLLQGQRWAAQPLQVGSQMNENRSFSGGADPF